VVKPPLEFSVQTIVSSDLPMLANGKIAKMVAIASNGRDPERTIDTKCFGIGLIHLGRHGVRGAL